MAQICEQCGKKIGVFSNEPLKLNDERFLCFDCAEPILSKIENLRYKKSKVEFNLLKTDILEKCHELYKDTIIQEIEKKIEQIYKNTVVEETEEQSAKKRLVENYMLTTGYDFSGYKIAKYVGVISGQVVLGTGFLSEFSAAFADFFGEASEKFADKLETAKNAAVEKLIIKSAEKGGNAIIGVDFDYITFHGNMIGVVANGTSVVIEEIKSQ